MLAEACEELVRRLACPTGAADYLRCGIPKLAASLLRAMALGKLETAVPVPVRPEERPVIRLSYGQRMENSAYAALLRELTRCGGPEEKAALVMSRVSAFGDMLEVLHDGDWTRDELLHLFRQFPPELLAALLASGTGGRKSVGARAFYVVLNQADDAPRRAAGERTLAILRETYNVSGFLTHFEEGERA